MSEKENNPSGRDLDEFLRDPNQYRYRSASIRLKCLDCCGNQSAEVRRCPSYNCPLWHYRMGGEWEKIPELELSRFFEASKSK